MERLQSTEAKLRTEEEQLRTRKQHLRTEKEQLRTKRLQGQQIRPKKKMKRSGMYFVRALYHFSKTSLSVTYNHH